MATNEEEGRKGKQTIVVGDEDEKIMREKRRRRKGRESEVVTYLPI